MVRVRRRNDQKLLVLAGIGGLVLIAAPIVVFSQLAERSEPSGVPSDLSAPLIVGEYARPGGLVDEPSPTSPSLWVSPLPGTSSRLDGAERVVLVATSVNGTVVTSTQTDRPEKQEISGWVGLGGSAAGDPVLATTAAGELTVFIVGTDGHLMQNRGLEPAVNGTSGWRDLGGEQFVGTPAVSQDAEGKLVVVARRADGSLWVTQQTAVVADTWSEWQQLPAPAAHDPAIYRDSHGELRIFASGPDGRLRTVKQVGLSGAEWSVPQDLGGSPAGPPAVILDAEGRLRVFVLDAAGAMEHNVETAAASDAWVGWENLGGQLMGRPFATTGARGGVAVHALDFSGKLREVFQAGVERERWSEWKDRGGNLARLVAVVQDRQGRFVAHGIGKKGGMERALQLVPSTPHWTDWATDLGGVFPTG